jgi:outer membrane protein TolC
MKALSISVPGLVLVGLMISGRLWGLPAQSAETSVPVLTLEDAIRIGTDNNRQLKIAHLEVNKAHDGVGEAKSYALPQLSAYGLAGIPPAAINFRVPAGNFGNFPSTGPIPPTDTDIRTPQRLSGVVYVTIDQPLTQLFKVRIGVQKARLGVDLASESVREHRQETVREIREAYYQFAQAQSQVEAASATVAHLTELAKIVDQRLEQKTVLLSDSLTVKARLKQADYRRLMLQNSSELARQNLNLLLGRDLSTPFTVDMKPPESAEIDLVQARQAAIAQRAELREARLATRIAEKSARLEKADYFPEISLQASYLSFQNINFLPTSIGEIGLLFHWQPFDWGLKHHRRANLLETAKQKRLTEQDAEQQILLDVEQKYRMLGAARALVEAQSYAQQAEREKLQELTQRYQHEAALLVDLLQQQSAVAQADAQYQQALAGFWTAKANLQRAMGAD